MSKQFEVTLTKSLIGTSETQRATLDALGLRKRQATRMVNDTPANRGQILKVQHLVKVVVKKSK
jgi:large subunit ribosomal protein L30